MPILATFGAAASGAFGLLSTPTYVVEYLAIAGGGGGGVGSGGGGGGAGGYLTSTLKIIAGKSYTITIGAGGASNTNGSNTTGLDLTLVGGGLGGGGNGGAGSAIDFYTYTSQGNGLPGARFGAIDDNNYGATFQWFIKADGNTGNNSLQSVLSINQLGNVVVPGTSTSTSTTTTWQTTSTRSKSNAKRTQSGI
jgi:hypothetical protein